MAVKKTLKFSFKVKTKNTFSSMYDYKLDIIYVDSTRDL